MSACDELSQGLKKQNVLMLEKSAVQNNEQKSSPQIEASILTKEHQEIRKSLMKPNDFSNDSHLETTRNSENFYKDICNSCEEESKQSVPLEIIKSQSELLEKNLRNGLENKAINACEKTDYIVPNGHQESTQLMKSVEEKIAPEKNRHEEDVPSMSEQSVATKKILFEAESELCLKNPYMEYILKSEGSNHHLCITGNSEELGMNSLASERVSKIDEKSFNNCVDIFGHQFTSKDRNKIKVDCPHCKRKVSAPGFVRHLSYCMRVGIRKGRRRF